MSTRKFRVELRCEKICWADVSKSIEKKEYTPHLVTCPRQEEIDRLEAELQAKSEAENKMCVILGEIARLKSYFEQALKDSQ